MKSKVLLGLFCVVFVLFMVTGCKKDVSIYTVTFDSKGGTDVEIQKIEKGSTVVRPEDPIREGYLFVEWVLENEGYDFSSKVMKDITLTANWVKEEPEKEYITIKFNSAGGTTIANQIVEKGKKVEKPLEPTKSGYTFVEWQWKDKKYNFEEVATEDMELVAKWEKNKTTLNSKPTTSKPSTNTGNNNSDNNSVPAANFSTPVLTEIPMGTIGTDGTKNAFVGIDKEQFGSLEIWYATSQNGNYSLMKTATKADKDTLHYSVSIPVGSCYYFKVRFISAGGVYSEYSNVVPVDNSNFQQN